MLIQVHHYSSLKSMALKDICHVIKFDYGETYPWKQMKTLEKKIC